MNAVLVGFGVSAVVSVAINLLSPTAKALSMRAADKLYVRVAEAKLRRKPRNRYPGRTLWALAWLLPRSEARKWIATHRGFMADIAERRCRRKYVASLALRMPGQLWTSWMIKIARLYRTKEMESFVAVLQFDTDHASERPAWSAVLTLSLSDLRTL